jgi:ABC-type nitrate/sulfonate/bicarbonate transport system permease component
MRRLMSTLFQLKPKDAIKSPFVIRFVVIAGVLCLWGLIVHSGYLNRALFPGPTKVVQAFWDMTLSGDLIADVGATLTRVCVGFVLGSLLGVIIGTLTARMRFLDLILGPIIQVLRPIPPIALVPLAIVWLGLGEVSKATIITWGVFFPVWVNTYTGVSAVDNTVIWAARSLGASRRRVLVKVVLPSALRHVVAGMRVGVAIAFVCVVVAEMLGAYVGLGFRINTSYLVFRVDRMMVGLLTLGLLGATADWLFMKMVVKVLPWYALNTGYRNHA